MEQAQDHRSNIALIKGDRSEIVCNSPLVHDKVIDSLLGPLAPLPESSAANEPEEPESASAYANLVTDLVIDSNEDILRRNVQSVLKGLQP